MRNVQIYVGLEADARFFVMSRDSHYKRVQAKLKHAFCKRKIFYRIPETCKYELNS